MWESVLSIARLDLFQGDVRPVSEVSLKKKKKSTIRKVPEVILKMALDWLRNQQGLLITEHLLWVLPYSSCINSIYEHVSNGRWATESFNILLKIRWPNKEFMWFQNPHFAQHLHFLFQQILLRQPWNQHPTGKAFFPVMQRLVLVTHH